MMCYVIITCRSIVWFILSLASSMLLITAIVTPKWLIGPEVISITSNFTVNRHPSVGIYTRCVQMKHAGFHCGPFDRDGFATDSTVYPPEWKAAMFFISMGFFIVTISILFILITCCRQSIFGKSIHNITGSAQVIAGISVMISLFLHPLGWGAARVMDLCGPDAEAFYMAECQIGRSMYCAIAGVVFCFMSGGISLKAESANMRSQVKRRVEEGERLVCVL